MGPITRTRGGLLAQRGHLFPFVPVFLGLGIGLYFALRVEPGGTVLWACALAGGAALGLALRAGPLMQAVLRCTALVALGLALAGLRAHHVAAPVLEGRYYGPVQGRIVWIDRSASDALRLTLDRVVLRDLAPANTPARVRVSLHGRQDAIRPVPGMEVILTGHLSPPGGPVEPGGFDFRRHAWFQSLGAVGYTRSPVLRWREAGRGGWLHRARLTLSARIQATLSGDRGAFAAAVLTGDRSGLAEARLIDLRHANLAHLLAISGLHMGLLAGFVFAVLRLAQAAVPRWCDRAPVRKIAAFGALLAAAGYLALSGGNVATQRAFIMAAVALGAVMADRRALTLRGVALAALIVLALRPEALTGPGFQMSFAATTALVAAFGALRDRGDEARRLPRWLRPVGAVVISSAVAGAATGPFAAAHFNIVAHYGLVANLATVPLMGLLVIPAGVLAMLLMPFGAEAPALWLMGQGVGWILGVAAHVSDLPGAVRGVPSPGPAVLPLLALGGAIGLLWQGRPVARAFGVVPVAAALALWWQAERPALLVAESGGLVGVMTNEGRALSKARGQGFVAGIWLENDGDRSDQPDAAARWPAGGEGPVREMRFGDARVVHVTGKRGLAAFDGCRGGDLVVVSVPATDLDCKTHDPETLRTTGSIAVMPDGRTVTARDRSGRRLWSPAPPDADRRFAKRQGPKTGGSQ